MGSVPTIDLTPWFEGSPAGRAAVAEQMDRALQSVGFFLVTGHGVSRADRAAVRSAARMFFGLPDDVKRGYAVTVGGRGWLPPGVEANGYAEGTETPPDMKESFAVGAADKTGIAEVDDFWFPDNVWPGEVPSLHPSVTGYLAQMRELAETLLTIAEAALSQQPGFLTDKTAHSTFTMNINWYPPATIAGTPEENQFRIGPHTDFGTFTILDREPGRGGLQVWSPAGDWEDAPYDPDAFTINTGDLLARWSGDRWKSNRHRVLPPQSEAPDEDLVSLVYFYEADWDARIESLQPPIGKVNDHPPVVASEFLKRLLDAITVG
jgi:isopenicillin N synthase-like dioxygenase